MWNYSTEVKRVTLAGGDAVSYLEGGEPDSQRVVFYFHGFPGSRLEGLVLSELAAKHGIKVIACDRPGMGHSDYNGGHSVASWGTVASEIADRLNIDKVSLIGVSGGGPYAVSAAAELGPRVKKLCLVSSMAPTDAPGVLKGMFRPNRWLLSQAPKRRWLVKPIVRSMASCWLNSPSGAVGYLRRILPKPDRELLSRAEFHKFFKSNLIEAFRSGVRGPLHEFWQLSAPWRVDFTRIKERAVLWHGSSDIYVPPGMSVYLAKSLPNAEHRVVEGEGHFAAFKLVDEVLREC